MLVELHERDLSPQSNDNKGNGCLSWLYKLKKYIFIFFQTPSDCVNVLFKSANDLY